MTDRPWMKALEMQFAALATSRAILAAGKLSGDEGGLMPIIGDDDYDEALQTAFDRGHEARLAVIEVLQRRLATAEVRHRLAMAEAEARHHSELERRYSQGFLAGQAFQQLGNRAFLAGEERSA